MRHLQLLTLASILLMSLAAAGCNDTDCPMGSANELKIRFLSVADTTLFAIDTLTVTASGTDSVLINLENDVTYITLPLNGTSLETTYTFHFTTISRDTVIIYEYLPDGSMTTRDTVITVPHEYADEVVVNYTAQQQFTSMDCGLVYSFDLETGRHSTNFIKSMVVVNTRISEENEDNIYMFF